MINQWWNVQTSPVKAGKVEKWLPSQTLNTSERSLVSLNKVGVKRVNPDQDMDSNGNVSDMTISGRASRQSPFRTPPSLSYCHDKVIMTPQWTYLIIYGFVCTLQFMEMEKARKGTFS